MLLILIFKKKTKKSKKKKKQQQQIYNPIKIINNCIDYVYYINVFILQAWLKEKYNLDRIY